MYTDMRNEDWLWTKTPYRHRFDAVPFGRSSELAVSVHFPKIMWFWAALELLVGPRVRASGQRGEDMGSSLLDLSKFRALSGLAQKLSFGAYS